MGLRSSVFALYPPQKKDIGETKRALRERFNEHRQSTNNPDHADASAAVPTHFNLPDHSLADIRLRTQPAVKPGKYFIEKGGTFLPDDLNRRNEN